MTDQERRMAIANRLREARKLSGLTQGQVAQRMRLHRPSISEIEAGNSTCSAPKSLAASLSYTTSAWAT